MKNEPTSKPFPDLRHCAKCGRSGWVYYRLAEHFEGVDDEAEFECRACGHTWWEYTHD